MDMNRDQVVAKFCARLKASHSSQTVSLQRLQAITAVLSVIRAAVWRASARWSPTVDVGLTPDDLSATDLLVTTALCTLDLELFPSVADIVDRRHAVVVEGGELFALRPDGSTGAPVHLDGTVDYVRMTRPRIDSWGPERRRVQAVSAILAVTRESVLRSSEVWHSSSTAGMNYDDLQSTMESCTGALLGLDLDRLSSANLSNLRYFLLIQGGNIFTLSPDGRIGSPAHLDGSCDWSRFNC